MSEPAEHPLVFFDGVCGLCNRFVNFVLKRDRIGKFHFAPLQGQTAASLLPLSDTEHITSVVFLHQGQVARHSTAIVRVLRELGGVWSLLGCLLWLVPRPLRDFGYRCIASQRYRIFGKKETCRLPTPGERARFLD